MTREDPGMRSGLVPPPERQRSLPEMSAGALDNYRRALVSYIRNCAQHGPWYEAQRACLAEVMAEQQERRRINRAEWRNDTAPSGIPRRPPARAGLDTARAGPKIA